MRRQSRPPRSVNRAQLVLALGACAACATEPADFASRSTCQAIVGGHPDSGHASVAALVDEFGQGYCAATLIGSTGEGPALLTAAHCLDAPVSHAAFGEDYRAPLEIARIERIVVHPDFDERTGELDLAVLLLGAELEGVAPLTVARDGDGLSTGGSVEFVGFGETDENAPNTQRNAFAGVVDTVSTTSFSYEQSAGGPCFGDSGGPAIAIHDGVPLLVGVTSFGDGGCRGRGVSTRVQGASSWLGDFLEPDPCASATAD